MLLKFDKTIIICISWVICLLASEASLKRETDFVLQHSEPGSSGDGSVTVETNKTLIQEVHRKGNQIKVVYHTVSLEWEVVE